MPDVVGLLPLQIFLIPLAIGFVDAWYLQGKSINYRTVAALFGFFLWPILVPLAVLYSLRYLPRGLRFVGIGVREIYRDVFPAKVKLPRAEVRR